MRVVVSVKAAPGGGNASQAARYIAYRDRDEEREGTEPRKLFSAQENALRKANTQFMCPFRGTFRRLQLWYRAIPPGKAKTSSRMRLGRATVIANTQKWPTSRWKSEQHVANLLTGGGVKERIPHLFQRIPAVQQRLERTGFQQSLNVGHGARNV